jgi:GTP cyclohydrolase I
MSNLKNNHLQVGSISDQEILNCKVKDSTGLNDFQRLPEQSGLAIDKVGINRFRIPLKYYHQDGTVVNHDTIASMYVTLSAGKTGINMSRLCAFLQEEAKGFPVGIDFIKNVLNRYHLDMRDDPEDPLLERAWLKLRFAYPTLQKSLKSANVGWQYYECALEGESIIENGNPKIRTFLTVNFEYSSVCPCSLSMARQYEKEFAEGKTSEGTGIATAHSQRSNCRCKVEFDCNHVLMIEDVVDLLRQAIPTETQSLVKRVDEQAFAIKNGQHPMFVEHATRRLALVLNSDSRILDWSCAVEHWESLHSHNAVGVISKGLVGGLR